MLPKRSTVTLISNEGAESFIYCVLVQVFMFLYYEGHFGEQNVPISPFLRVGFSVFIGSPHGLT